MNLTTHHIALKVESLERCEDFYGRVLGLPAIDHRHDENGAVRSVWFDLREVILMLERCEKRRRSQEEESPGWHLLALRISEEERGIWETRLAQAKVAITGRSPYSIYFTDPEGNRLAMSHYPEAVKHEVR